MRRAPRADDGGLVRVDGFAALPRRMLEVVSGCCDETARPGRRERQCANHASADAGWPLEVVAAEGEPYHRYALIVVD